MFVLAATLPEAAKKRRNLEFAIPRLMEYQTHLAPIRSLARAPWRSGICGGISVYIGLRLARSSLLAQVVMINRGDIQLRQVQNDFPDRTGCSCDARMKFTI